MLFNESVLQSYHMYMYIIQILLVTYIKKYIDST